MLLVLFIGMIASTFWFSSGYSEAAGQATDCKIVIFKEQRILELHQNGRIQQYRVCLGLNPTGPKQLTGDKKTPEGEYFICYKSAESNFHRFLGISYPGVDDAKSAFEKGIISLSKRDEIVTNSKERKAPPWNTELGGWVGIHGYPSDEYKRRWVALFHPKPDDWTDGCIALWNFEIEQLFSRVSLGTPVVILP